MENQIFASSALVTAFKLRYLMQGLFLLLFVVVGATTRVVGDAKKCEVVSSAPSFLFLDSVLSDPENAACVQKLVFLLGVDSTLLGVDQQHHIGFIFVVQNCCLKRYSNYSMGAVPKLYVLRTLLPS